MVAETAANLEYKKQGLHSKELKQSLKRSNTGLLMKLYLREQKFLYTRILGFSREKDPLDRYGYQNNEIYYRSGVQGYRN